MPVLLQQAAPVFCVVAGYRHQRIGKIPPGAHQDAPRHFVPYGGFYKRKAQSDLRPTLLVELLKVASVQQDRGHGLGPPCPLLLRGGAGTVGTVCADKAFPVGACFIAPIHAEVQWQAHRAADIMTRDWMVGEGIRVIAMIVMTVDRVKQLPHRLTQGLIEHQDGVSLLTTDRLWLLEQRRDATVIDVVVEPWRCREEAGQVGFVRPLEPTARDVRQTFVGQDDQTCQVRLKMAKLAPILQEITKDVRVGSHDRSRSDDGKLHKTSALSPKGGGRA